MAVKVVSVAFNSAGTMFIVDDHGQVWFQGSNRLWVKVTDLPKSYQGS